MQQRTMSRKQTVILTVISLLLLLGTFVTIFVLNKSEEARLENLQNELIEILDSREGEYDTQSIVLKNTSHSEAKQLAERFGAELRIIESGRFATLTLPEGVTIRDIYALDENKDVIEQMSPDFHASITDTDAEETGSALRLPSSPQYAVSDTGYSKQTYLDYMNLGKVWNTTKGEGITVAVIDTGIDYDHPEFAGKISEYSYNATEDKIVKDYFLDDGVTYDWSLVEDVQGHGTAVAGVIAASMDGAGTVGVAPAVNIVAIKVECDANGGFYRTSDLVFALYYAIERDVDVVNMSFGGYDAVNPYAEATRLAVDSDIICVAAAGNDATAALCWPAADENVISVGALADGSWDLAEYSNYGENSDIVAPGTTYTTKNDGTYKSMDGTSFACPNVAGGIALYLSQNRYATFESVRENVYASCYDLGDLGEDWYYGYGAFDVNALVLEQRGKVIFNMLTDELDNTEQIFVRHHTLQDLPEPERTYAVFDGWYYDIDCTEPLNYYADEFSSDLTLYAKWVNEDDGVPYTYVELGDGTIEIRSYTGKRRYITIPEYIDGKVVSSIGEFAFAGQSRLREIKLPAQLTRIRMSAFSGCNNLVSIEIPNTVTSIGEGAFADNIRLSAVAFGGSSKLTEIGSEAFKNCAKLTRFEIPAGVTALDGSVFVGTTSMQKYSIMGGDNAALSVLDGVLMNATKTKIIAYPAGRTGEYDIPEGVGQIGDYAFAYSKITAIDLDGVSGIGAYGFMGAKLASLAIPDSVTSLGIGAFANNVYLKTVTIGKGLTSISAKAFEACYTLESIEIPTGIQNIGSSAFALTISLKSLTFAENSTLVGISSFAFEGSGIESVTLPESLVYIGEKAFSQTALIAVDFEDGSALQTIGENAFADSGELSAFEMPSGIMTIGAYAFQGTALTEVTLPASLTSLGAGAYASCHSLENIFVDDANTVYTDIDGVVYTADKATIVAYPAGNSRTSYTVNGATTTIAESAFHGSANLNYVYLPANLVYIERYAFTECTNLYSIDIPDSVYQISNYAFAYDYNLTSINFTENATLPRISYGAFAHTGIMSFRVPASVSTMAQDAFKGCTNLYSITFAAGSKLESISAYMFKGCEQLTSITFEAGSKLTSIQAHGFEGMTNLTSVDFGGAQITNIDNYAFRYCESLTTLYIPEGVDYIGRYAFYGCKSLTRLNIPASVDYIGENAFYFAENLDIYFAADSLPANLAQNWDNGIRGYYVGVANVVENEDFRYAVLSGGGISIIEYKGSAKNIDLTAIDFGGNIVSIGGYAFHGAEIESIVLPATLKEIHRYAFAFTKLAKIDIPESVTFIGQYAFLTSDIAEVNFGENAKLETIEQYAFTNTKNLKAIALPASLKTLGRFAFSQSGLESADFSACTLEKLPEGAFMGTNLTEVALPDSVTLIDHNAFRDCKLLVKVTFGVSELQLMSNVFYNTGLTELYIPDNLTYIGEYSFVGLEKLTEFKVSATHPKYTAIDGLLYSKDGRKLIAAPAGRAGEITLPESLEILGFGAFENSKFGKISFHPDSNILTFGYRCFYNSAITELNVPKTVVSFDFYAFARCKNLTTVNFAADNQLKGIYEGAFYGCLNLTNIVLPESIVEISDYAFYGCTALEKLPISENAEVKGIYDYAFAYASFEELTLPGTLIDIGNYAFKGAKMTSVVVPDDNKEQLIIGIGAFEECNNLAEITLPFIGASFEDMDITWFGYIFGAGGYEANNTYVPESLKTVTISEGIGFVGTGAFYGVQNVEQVNVPHSVTGLFECSFGDSTFRYELTNTVVTYYLDSFGNLILGEELNGSYIGIGFYGDIYIGDSIKNINMSSIDLAGLSAIYVSENNTIYSSQNGILYNKARTEIIYVPYSVKGEIVIPDNVTHINDYIFQSRNKFTSIVIGSGVTQIGDNAFYGCYNLCEIKNNSKLVLTPGGEDNGAIAYYANVIVDANGTKTYRDGENFIFIETPEGFKFSYCNGEYKLISYIGTEDTITLPFDINGKDYDLYYFSGAKNVIIPNGITNIHSNAFRDSNIVNITIPDSVKSIGDYAFYNCDHLRYIVIADGVTNIGAGAFTESNNLTSVTIGSGVTNIAYDAFDCCFKLEKIVVKEDNAVYSSQDGILYNKDKTQLRYVPYNKKGDIFIIDSVTSIGEYAFMRHHGFETITIPSQVTDIGANAFWMCNVKKVIFEEGSELISIGERAFYDCWQLMSITLPDSVISIGDFGFGMCYRLSTITIPSRLESIGESVFYKCDGIENIIVNDGNLAVTLQDGILYNAAKTEIIYVSNDITGTVTLPGSVTKIYANAFESKYIDSIVVEESNAVYSSQGGFLYNKAKTQLIAAPYNFKGACELPESITTGIDLLFGCYGIESIIIGDNSTLYSSQEGILYNKEKTQIVYVPKAINGNITIANGVTSIDNEFHYCSGITSITIPESVTNISQYAFTHSNRLSELVVDENNAIYSSYTGIMYNKNKTEITISAPQNITSIVIPESVTYISDFVFNSCNRLVEVYNLSSLNITKGSEQNGGIGMYALDVYTSCDISGNLKQQGDYIVYNNGTDRYLVAYVGNDSNITLPENIDGKDYYIYPHAFYNDDIITDIIITKGVSGGLEHAFYGCDNLKIITVDEEHTKYASQDGFLYIKEKKEIIAVANNIANSVIIPQGVKVLDEYLFWNRDITGIVIPNSVTHIENAAFLHCAYLNDIEIPDSIKYIGNTVFDETAYFYNLNNWVDGGLYIGNHLIAVDSSVEGFIVREGTITIAQDAFEGCYNLKSVELSGNHYGVLVPLTNLETLVLTKLPTEHKIYNYFGWDASNIPLTLKTIVLKDGCDISDVNLFEGITGVNIYVETDEINTQWDHDLPGWNSGNRVYYGGEWVEAKFYDADGSLISNEYYTTSQVIRQPYVENIVNGDNIKLFVGWDIDGDGIADAMPATSAANISAYAVYKEHTLGELVSVAPTCTEDGYTQRVCTECGEIIEHTVRKATGHTSAGLLETVAPTCADDGYERHTCAVCGVEYQTNFTPALEHTFGEWIVDSAASCTTAGAQHRECSVCHTVENEVVAKLDHKYTSKVVKAATCKTNGEMLYTCEVCKNKITVLMDKLPHNYVKVKASKSFIQWLIEFVLNIVCGYEGNDCFYYKCSVCNAFMTQEEYSYAGSSSSVSGAHCNHTQGEWTIEKKATCVDGGVEKVSCTKCDEILQARVTVADAENGHIPATAVEENRIEPDCTTAGSYDSVVYCTECGEELSRERKDAEALDHDFSVEKHDATHHWTKCVRCDEIDGKAEHIGGTATCTVKANCSVCGTEYGDFAAHSYATEWSKNKEEHWHECACGAISDKAGHAYGNDNVCDVCGYSKPTNTTSPSTKVTTKPSTVATTNKPSGGKDGGGCGSSIATCAILFTSVIGLGIGFIRKKKN